MGGYSDLGVIWRGHSNLGGHLEGAIQRGSFRFQGVIQILHKIFAICKASEDFVPFTVNLLYYVKSNVTLNRRKYYFLIISSTFDNHVSLCACTF